MGEMKYCLTYKFPEDSMSGLKVRQTLIASLIATLSMTVGAQEQTLNSEYGSGLTVKPDDLYVGSSLDATTSISNPNNTNHFTVILTGGTIKDLGTLNVDGGILFNQGGTLENIGTIQLTNPKYQPSDIKQSIRGTKADINANNINAEGSEVYLYDDSKLSVTEKITADSLVFDDYSTLSGNQSTIEIKSIKLTNNAQISGSAQIVSNSISGSRASINAAKLTTDSLGLTNSSAVTISGELSVTGKTSMIDSEIKGADQFTSSSLEIRGNSSVTANAVIIQNDLNVINTEGDTDTSLSTSSLSVGKITANDDFSITMNNSGIAEIGEVFAKNGTLQLNGSVETNKLTVAESATMSTGSLSFVGLNTAKPSANTMTVEGTLDADNVTVEYGRVRLLSNTSDIGEIILNNGASLIAGDGSEGLRLNTVTMNSKTGSAYDFFQAYQDISIDTLNMNGISRLEGYSTTDNDVQINVSSLNVANGATAQFVNSTGNSDASVNVTDAKVSDGGIIANTNLGNPDKQTYQNLSFANLNSTNATIQNGAGGQISIGEMSGTNSVIQVADTKANQISITTNKSSNLTVTSLDSSYGNKMTSVDQGVADLAGTTVLGEDSTEGMKVVIGANDMTGRVEAVYDAEGNKVSQTEEVNETNRTLTAIANLPVVAWRAELNDLYKRMGDLRATPYKSGAWVRYNGGKFKWSDGDLENDFHMIQVGIDTMPTESNIRFGTAFSYTKGDADFDGGSADLDTYSLALYGTWLGDKGQYVDVIGRVASIKNDANARSLTGQGKAYDGKMDNTGLSLSAEAGWRFALPYNLFIEPQVEATYSYIDSDSFRYGDRKYELQSTDSFIARAGFMAGIQCPDNKGNVYVRASVVHDFLGETDVKVSNAHMSRTVSNDFGGTWGEFGIGANVSVSDNTYVYADVEHTTGGEIEEPWRVNFGVRYNF